MHTWYGHLMRMNDDDFVKFESRIKGRGVLGTTPIKWVNNMDGHWKEGVGMRGMECESRRLFCCDHSLGGSSYEGTVS